jgi:hypothetical protein
MSSDWTRHVPNKWLKRTPPSVTPPAGTGAQCGHAEYVDRSTTGVVSGCGCTVLLDNGEAWYYDDSEFRWIYTADLPVPVSQIKFWCGASFVNTANDTWKLLGGDQGWFNCGSPAGGTGMEPSTWGQIKARFRE